MFATFNMDASNICHALGMYKHMRITFNSNHNAESNLLTGIGYICHNRVLDAMYQTDTISVLGTSIAT